MGDRGQVKDRVLVGQGIEAGVVAEGALGTQFIQLDVAFEYDLGVGRNLQIDGFALDKLDRLAAQKTGDEKLLNFGRRGHDGGEGGRGIGADGDGNLQPRTLQVAERHLRKASYFAGAVGNGDRAASRLGHRRHTGALRAVLVLFDCIG